MSDDLVEAITEVRKEEFSTELKEKKVSWRKGHRYDSSDIESHNFPRPHHGHDSKVCPLATLPPDFHPTLQYSYSRSQLSS